jgi:hypothetical protein
LVGFYISATIETHKYPAQNIITCAKARLVENEATARAQTPSRQTQYFLYLRVGEVMEHAKREESVSIPR